MSTWIALYAATLSTLVAALQFAEWRRRSSYIEATCRETWAENTPYFEFSIYNRGPFPTKITSAMVGVRKRTWRRWSAGEPWSFIGLQQLVSEEPLILGDPVDGTVLEPGGHVSAIATQDTFQILLLNKWDVESFKLRRCLWIEHSQSDKPFTLDFRIPPELQVANPSNIPIGRKQIKQARKEGIHPPY